LHRKQRKAGNEIAENGRKDGYLAKQSQEHRGQLRGRRRLKFESVVDMSGDHTSTIPDKPIGCPHWTEFAENPGSAEPLTSQLSAKFKAPG